MRREAVLIGRAPRGAEVGLVVVWMMIVASAAFSSVPFAMGSSLVLFVAPPHGGVDELIVIGAVSAMIGACAGALTLLGYTITMFTARAPGAKAAWLRGAQRASGWMMRALWGLLA